jgi:hypothetical protein
MGGHVSLKSAIGRKWARLLLFGAASAAMPMEQAHSQDVRSYVVSWFSLATNSADGDCSKGIHPEVEKVWGRYIDALEPSPATREKYKRQIADAKDMGEVMDFLSNRGRIDGKPANAFRNPASVIDVDLPGLDGKLGYGFNLDGKGESKPSAFEDPLTHQRGVENQLYRAMGCVRTMRGQLDNPPTYWKWVWGQLRDSIPAWIITVKAADLTRDGPATIVFDRALEHARANPDGSFRANMSYRLDPDPRSHNEYQGEIRNGVVTIVPGGKFRLLADPLLIPEFALSRVNVRLYLKPDGRLDGFVGGFQSWHDIYGGLGGLAIGGEQQVTGDIVQFYHLMRKHADADPDPVTGQNMSISATYYLTAVPAFAAPAAPATQNVAQR